jgi:myo-inositol-1(or 4)-monophosphatase
MERAVEIAREAGALVREHFGRVRSVEFKGVVDPVTEADTETEDLILERLRREFPEHRILAEESGGEEWGASGPPIWLVDPIDGTNNFAHDFPHVGISLALVWEREPLVGVIYDPLRDELFAAAAGEGTTMNGEPVHVTETPSLADAFLATGFPYDRRTAADNNVQRLDHFLRRSQGVRRAGAATLDLAYVACGRFDGFWEIRLNPWDVAAGGLLVREAGGRATDFDGELDCLSGDAIVASNGHIHDEMLRVIREGADAPRPGRS